MGRIESARIDTVMRYIIALGVAILIVAMAWPYLRRYAPGRKPGVPKPASRGELIYFALLVTIALSFAISTTLWVFGR
jgi:hypothetical protein